MNDAREARIIEGLHTEQRNRKSIGIAELSVIDILARINEEDHAVAARVREALPEIARAVALIERRVRAGGRMVYVGAGTSGRLGFMDAAECAPTYGVSFVQCVMAGGRDAVFQSREALEDRAEHAAQDLRAFGLTAGDAVVAAAASGRTPYCVGALEYARALGAGRVSISCNPHAVLTDHAEVGIEVDTGPEIIMGSTRMKAGTAQKMVMNMLSTAVMIRLGRTYDNLMVHIRAHNQKADNRVLRLFAEAVGNPDAAYAERMISEADGDLALAVLAALSGLAPEDAGAALRARGGDIRAALSDMRRAIL